MSAYAVSYVLTAMSGVPLALPEVSILSGTAFLITVRMPRSDAVLWIEYAAELVLAVL